MTNSALTRSSLIGSDGEKGGSLQIKLRRLPPCRAVNSTVQRIEPAVLLALCARLLCRFVVL